MSQQSRALNPAAIFGRVADARRRRRFKAMTASMSNRDLMDIGYARDYLGAVRKLPSDWE